MLLINILQGIVAVVALLLQVWATLLARPFKAITPPALWRVLIMLNLFVLCRRSLSVAEIALGWNGQMHESATALIGLAVSISMMATVVMLRKHLKAEAQEIADERQRTQDLAALVAAQKNLRVEDSDAYKLALRFLDKQSGGVSKPSVKKTPS